jgi:hypothetical protein
MTTKNENIFDLDKTDPALYYFWLGDEGVMVHADGNDYSLEEPEPFVGSEYILGKGEK